MECGRFADPQGVWPQFCSSCAPEPAIAKTRLDALARRYRTSIQQLNAWFSQGCGIAGCKGILLHVDHNHDCCPKTPTCGSCTRGVLCTRHNTGLEAFLDSPTVFAYLQRTAAGRRTLADYGFTEDPIEHANRQRKSTTSRNGRAHRRREARKRREANRLGK